MKRVTSDKKIKRPLEGILDEYYVCILYKECQSIVNGIMMALNLLYLLIYLSAY